MTLRALHQFAPGLATGDAITDEAFVLRGIFRSWGLASDIFCERRRILPELRRETRDIGEYEATDGPDTAVLLHLSAGSPVNERFARIRGGKAILYHNVTPPHFFRGMQEQVAANLEKGRDQVARLAGVADVVLADSRYNAEELAGLGYPTDIGVLPLVLDLARLRGPSHRATEKEYRDGRTNLLFVSRVAPNKRIEDLYTLLHVMRGTVDPQARLLHAGSYGGMEVYHALLMTYLRQLELQGVTMLGKVGQDVLNALYQTATVFVCLSEHEGFCIPVLEAMVHDVPVVAYATGAVEETLDGAGVLVREKRFPELAELVGDLARPGPLREAVLAGQRARLARFEARNVETELRGLLAPILSGS